MPRSSRSGRPNRLLSDGRFGELFRQVPIYLKIGACCSLRRLSRPRVPSSRGEILHGRPFPSRADFEIRGIITGEERIFLEGSSLRKGQDNEDLVVVGMCFVGGPGGGESAIDGS